ncbi:BnaC09g13630D [Brassica napus]|uniref:BnaC09g13630D protein n=1 Tax=Brassica napus TaxID=3708 RepID=A0A078FYY4_BRANA|nr:BnaC09g13630D [Brassica napus]
MMKPSDHVNVLRTGPLSCSSILALPSNTLFLQPQREQRWCLDDNMRPDLPGKKYFAIKGPIPGSKPSSSSSSKAAEQKPNSKHFKEPNYQKKNKLKALKLLCSRELSGSVIALNNKKNKSNFKEEIEKTHASNPLVWRYDSTKNIGDAALKEFQVDIQTFQGLTTKNILVAGSN